MPKSNVDFWKKKLYGNRERDERNQKELEEMGWNVITVWECELKKDKREQTLEELYEQMINSYDIQSAGHIDTLKLVCKTSLKAN
jgi:DNA mismatch endonuclease (patch repair protein)